MPHQGHQEEHVLRGERLRCLFAYLVWERRVSLHHDSRVMGRHDGLAEMQHNILVKPRHKKLVMQRKAHGRAERETCRIAEFA